MYPGKDTYDALLEEFSEGLSVEMLDPFFANSKGEACAGNTRRLPIGRSGGRFPAPSSVPDRGAARLSSFVMDFLGIDRDSCVIGEDGTSLHNHEFNKHDVRLTTHYHEDDVLSNMFSVAHEGGIACMS